MRILRGRNRKAVMGAIVVMLATSACATSVRRPGDPLTDRQVETIRAAQRSIRDGRGVTFAADQYTEAYYLSVCGKLDPVTRERLPD